MDQFKSAMQCRCSPGGIFCECCNRWRGKDKYKLRRIVRRKIKLDDKKAMVEYQTEQDEDFQEWFDRITA
jgi:hypothetical protein